MLSSGMLKQEVEIILGLLVQSKIEEARQKIQLLAPKVSSDYSTGALLALNGVLNMLVKPKNEQVLDAQKIQRTVDRILKVHTIDDIDKGYLQTFTKWVKMAKTAQAQASEPQS